MSATPEIVTRAEQPYAAIKARVPMSELGAFAARHGEVFAWLGARGLPPAGAPFFKYNVIDMARELEVEAGVPVAAAMDGDADVLSGVLPAGRYATVIHVGHPDKLVEATGALLDWAAGKGLKWDISSNENGEERRGCPRGVFPAQPPQEPCKRQGETPPPHPPARQPLPRPHAAPRVTPARADP